MNLPHHCNLDLLIGIHFVAMHDSVRICLVKGQMNGKEIILVETVVFEFCQNALALS